LGSHRTGGGPPPLLVLDFRRAPEHKYPAQLDDAEAAFNWLLSEGYEPGNIITIGHSIGGFIAVALALRLRDKKQPLPGAVVSISPWCDLEIAHETMVTNAETDKILSKDLLEFFRESWVGGTGIALLTRSANSSSSPARTSHVPQETSRGETAQVRPGIDTATVVVPGGLHSYVYGAGRVPETDAAIEQIGAWVREKTKI
jgi:acetyl esterase/lipase